MIGILSDIHGNFDAFEAVSRELKKLKIKRVIFLGDMSGYYYEFSKCMEGLKEFEFEFILGNHDRMLLESISNKERLDIVTQKYGLGCSFACHEVSSEELALLRSSEPSKSLRINDIEISLCHSNPWGTDEHIYENSDSQTLDRFIQFNESKFVIGHSHYQFRLHHGEKEVISVGSVGQNRKNGGIACWAILTDEGDIVLKQTQYDISRLLTLIKDEDPKKKYLTEVLQR